MKYRHYSPQATIHIISQKDREDTISQLHNTNNIKFLSYKNAQEMAHSLFHDFRQADKE